jgi:uncharacterized OsmC-like protein
VTSPSVREYTASGHSTDTFGRVLCSARDQHWVADGPAQNGCPGEAVSPAELFLAGVASCGVELVQVVAREQNVPLNTVAVQIQAFQDRDAPARQDYSTFNKVHLAFTLQGVSEEQARDLVDRFRRR